MLVPCLTCPCSAVVTVTVDFVTSKIGHGPWHTPRASPFYRPRPHTSASMHLASRIPRGSHLAHRTPHRCGAAIRPTSVPSHTVSRSACGPPLRESPVSRVRADPRPRPWGQVGLVASGWQPENPHRRHGKRRTNFWESSVLALRAPPKPHEGWGPRIPKRERDSRGALSGGRGVRQ